MYGSVFITFNTWLIITSQPTICAVWHHI